MSPHALIFGWVLAFYLAYFLSKKWRRWYLAALSVPIGIVAAMVTAYFLAAYASEGVRINTTAFAAISSIFVSSIGAFIGWRKYKGQIESPSEPWNWKRR